MKKELIVVSSYPPYGQIHGEGVIGIAGFTKNVLLGILKSHPDTKITVLADQLAGSSPEYVEHQVLIRRVWRRESPVVFLNILKEVMKKPRCRMMLIQFGFSVFGDFLRILPILPFLITLKIMGKKITFVFHEVVLDLDKISGHVGMKNGSMKIKFINFFINFFYVSVLNIVDNVIVLEEDFKHRLQVLGHVNKITVIPHGIDNFKSLPNSIKAREILGLGKRDFTILCFGFIAWYKGIDWLVDVYDKLGGIKLVIAGGANPNKINSLYYQKYVKSIESKCKQKGITLTGFIKESYIKYYFQAADLVVLPYRTFMGSSAQLCFSFSFNKPFLLSKALIGLCPNAIFFKNKKDFIDKIHLLKKNEALRKKNADLSKEISRDRSWKKIGAKYYETIFN